MVMKISKMRMKILKIAREILASEGLGAISFDAIARRLGCSKQAVLYWFPTKRDLLSGMFLPMLQAESEVAVNAVSNAKGRNEAITCFIRAVARFHLGDLDRFRIMYLLPQTTVSKSEDRRDLNVSDDIHSVTALLYGALAYHLGTDQGATRQEAVTIHSSVLGLVLMFALTDSLDDPMKHSVTDLIETLIACLTNDNRASDKPSNQRN